MIIKNKDLPFVRKKEKKLVFASGTFDLPHAGHTLFFKDCQKYGKTVIGVGSDEDIKNIKYHEGPIMNESIRLFMIDNIKGVDYTILTDSNGIYSETSTSDPLLPILDSLRPDYWVVNSDSPGIENKQIEADKRRIELVVLDRECPKEFNDISTYKIVKQIYERMK